MYSLRHVLLKLASWLRRQPQQGVTVIEYALIGGVTVLAIVTGATAVGINLSSIFIDLTGSFPAR